MPYEQSDPRSQLATMTAPRASGASFPPQYFELGVEGPDEVTAQGTSTWYVRSQSCALAYSDAAAGEVLAALNAAPTTGRIIARIGPVLGMMSASTTGDSGVAFDGSLAAK